MLLNRDGEPNPAEQEPDWLTRLFEEKMARGGGPDHAAALEAIKRHDELLADFDPADLGDDDLDVDDVIDAMGLRKNIAEDWPVVPWSYWEARGAGPYRR
jgi:hypothetical protein